MKTLVIYDSFFGNTEKIAQAIGNTLGAKENVSVVRVGEAKPPQLAGLALLVVGSPTRIQGLTGNSKLPGWHSRQRTQGRQGCGL